MPVYNTEKYVETAVYSVLMQTNADFELICIDDCSTDSSLEILKNLSNLDSRIKIYENDLNRGAAYCRNLGINVSNGDYIFFLDSDDWINFNTFETLEPYAKSNNLDILMFKFITYWDDINSFSVEPFYDMEFMNKYDKKVFTHIDLEPQSLFEIPGANCNKLYSKEFLIKINLKFPEGLMFEDTAVFFEYMLKAKRISLINDYFYNRRRRKNSVMTTTGKKIFDIIPITEDLMNLFLNDNDIYARYKKGVINIVFSILGEKYKVINNKYNEEYIQKVDLLINKFDEKYNIIKDIENNINGNNLEFYTKLPFNKLKPYNCDLKNFRLSLGDDLLISDLKITDNFLKDFINNTIIYNQYKKTFLRFIFEKLKEKCNTCHDDFKEEIFQQCKYLVNKFYSEYDLYFDIMEYVDSDLIDFFSQDFI